MPIHKRAPAVTSFASATALEGVMVEIQCEENVSGIAEAFPVQGEITQSFDIADSADGWHLVWLDEAFQFEGEPQAYLMIAARWVAKPLGSAELVPIHIRLVPDVTLVEAGAPDIEKLPLIGKGTAQIFEEVEE